MSKRVRDKSTKLPGAFDLIRPGYEAFGINLLLYVVLMVLPVLLTLPLGMGANEASRPETIQSLGDIFSTSDLLTLAVGLITLPALTYVQLKSARAEKVTPKEAWRVTTLFFIRIVVLQIVIMIMTIIGLLLFIIPGLIVLRRYFLASYYLLDDNCSVAKAMKRSRKDSEMFAWSIWGILGLGALLSIALLIPLVNIVAIFLMFSYAFIPALRYHQIRAEQGWTFDQKAIPPVSKPESS